MNNVRNILLVDADHANRSKLATYLQQKMECVIVESDSPDRALEIVRNGNISLMISDMFLPEKTGMNLLHKAQQLDPALVTIAAVPDGERELAFEILKQGAFSYVQTPYTPGEVAIIAARGLEYGEVVSRNAKPTVKSRNDDGFCGITGKVQRMRKLFSLLEKVAGDDTSTVLVQGESGTGKELVARAIHDLSSRKSKNFVPLNCAAIPGELLESELFGYAKGAFTGATQSKIGRVEFADKGTLFLDEIGDMAPALQAKLLRFLQEREFEPVGGLKSVKVDIRVVAATHRNLEELVANGTFREDLYYRLNVLPITIPPLRERREDIPLLVEKFIVRFNNKRKMLLGFDRNALDALQQYSWPGNIRELENLVQRMSIIHEGQMIGLKELPAKYRPKMKVESITVPAMESIPPEVSWSETGIDFNSLTSEYEDHLILQALAMSKGNKKEAARLLNLKRTTLLEKIKKKQLNGSSGHPLTWAACASPAC